MATGGEKGEICLFHGADIEYFCQSCDTLACSQCMQAEHSKCKNLTMIDDLKIDIENFDEYKKLQDDINEIKDISAEITENINERCDYVKTGLSEEKETLARLRADMNAIFDNIQANIEEKESEADFKDTENIEKITSDADTAIMELESIENKLENLKRAQKFKQFFITLKQAKPTIRKIESKMDKLVSNSNPQNLGQHPVLPKVKGETEVNLIQLEEAVIKFKMLLSKTNLTQEK